MDKQVRDSQMEPTPSAAEEIIQPLRKSRKKWLYTGAAVIVVLGVGIPITLAKTRSHTSIPANDWYTVGYGNVLQTISTSGTIVAPTTIDLDFQGTQSVVTSIPVHIGEKVKAGQILATENDQTEQIAVAQAQSTVSEAEASLQSAEAKLQQDEAGVTPTQLALDKEAVTKAQSSLQEAQQQYQDQLAAYNDRTSEEQAVQSAQAALTQAEDELNQPSDQVSLDEQKLQDDETALQQDQQQLQDAIAQYGNITESQVQNAYQAYQTAQETANYWASHYTGNNPYEAQVSQTQTQYQLLETGYSAIQQAQQAVNNEQQAVQTDKTTLQNDQASQSSNQQKLEQTVQEDKQALQLAEEQYNNPISAKQALDSAQANVTQAQEALQTAELTLQNDEQPATPATIAQDEASIASAQAQVQNAEASLQNAQLNESETVIRAPISGVITAINGVVGETASEGEASKASSSSSSGSGSGTGLIEMADLNPDDLAVQLDVAESQIGSVHPGESVQFTVPAYPNQTFTGTITQVYPTPVQSSSVTEYTVMAAVNNDNGSLKAGMSASATIDTASANHVLSIPAIALHQLGSIEGVYVDTSTGNRTNSSKKYSHFANSQEKSGKSPFSAGLPAGVHFQPVQVGLMGTNTVQITSGLTAGEKILLVLPGQTAAAIVNSQSSGFHFGGGFGGGAGFAGGGHGGNGGGAAGGKQG
ncbi:HlyD family efflux transporter periplasmic adaptor subunit [Alicyclobacillus tolerans]|uniref:HlyD family efflux transporter periplasmic adaptor subunit n=1 Tax=Alicyclobacillus tolerans TaxID=90970 RepID=UPI003B810C86